jgi:hypothetical protein
MTAKAKALTRKSSQVDPLEYQLRGIPMPQPEPILGIEAFQIQKTALPTHKVIRFQTALGPVALMATRKWMLDIGRAMIASAEDMTEPS